MEEQVRKYIFLVVFGQYEKAIKFIHPEQRKSVIYQYDQKSYCMQDRDLVYETKRNTILQKARFLCFCPYNRSVLNYLEDLSF